MDYWQNIYCGDVQCVDDETLRIIYEQIQEVSDMGDSIKAGLLKRFVDEELVQGKVSSSIPFDVAFDNWCNGEMQEQVMALALKWGLDKEMLNKAVQSYDIAEPEKIPYMERDSRNVVFFAFYGNEAKMLT